jgi:hypothetical protein
MIKNIIFARDCRYVSKTMKFVHKSGKRESTLSQWHFFILLLQAQAKARTRISSPQKQCPNTLYQDLGLIWQAFLKAQLVAGAKRGVILTFQFTAQNSYWNLIESIK